MNARKWIAIVAILGTSPAVLGSKVDGISIAHIEPVERLSVQSVSRAGLQKPGVAGPVDLSFDALGRAFELELEPNASLFSSMTTSGLSIAAIPYRGRIAGFADSWARIVVVDGMPAGLIWDGSNLFALEIPGDSVLDASAPVIYRLADAVIAPGTLGCATGTTATNGSALFKTISGELGLSMTQGPGAVSEINVGAVGDFLFAQDKGANAQAAIITRLNNVDGIFSQQLGVQITVPVIQIFDTGDPFTVTTDSGALLSELRSYRAGEPIQNSQGLTHMYTGRVLDGPTVGIAYTGALCDAGFGAGLSEGNGGATFDSLIAAHEIGHNFGAVHDGNVPCENTPQNFIMAPTLNGSNQFSACSIATMQQTMVGRSCITPLPTTDISVEFNESDPTVLLSNAATVTFDVINRGTQAAQNVIADVSLPANVSFITASGGAGTCTENAGTVNCQMGDIAGSTATTIIISADTMAVGVDAFDASIVADFDERPNNNQATALLTVSPAVNLTVTTPPAPTITINQSTVISAALENVSALNATAVTLSVSLDTGLRADSATWSIGSCTVAAQQVDCVATQFDSQTSSTVSLGVTGMTSGTKGYSVALASAEADADPSNNSVAGTIRVNAEANSDGGGGGFGLWFLALLGLAALPVSGSRRIS